MKKEILITTIKRLNVADFHNNEQICSTKNYTMN